MKISNFFCFLIFGLVFTSCDPEINANWKISNQSSKELNIDSYSSFSFDTDTVSHVIPLDSTALIYAFWDIGTSDDFKNDVPENIHFDYLEITNSDGQSPTTDIQLLSNWECSEISNSRVEYLLVLTDDDF